MVKQGMGWILFILTCMIYLLYMVAYKKQVWAYAVALAAMVALGIVVVWYFSKWTLGHRLGAVAVYAATLVFIAWIASPKVQQVPVTTRKHVTYSEPITVREGQVSGVVSEDGSVTAFAGIPYAKAPMGELRWREPQQAECWEGVKVCDTYAPMAMQRRSSPIYAFGSRIVGYHEIPISLDDNYIEAMSEDCLYLNIWMPSGAKAGDNLPVLFYIHGGSLNSGQSYYGDYNGEALAKQGIVFVNIAYRVGVFGYLADEKLAEESPNGTTGNYGLLDQIAALQWVNDNIAAFGGDASNITIAGESAGSSSVNAVCVSPLAKGLFRRAIAESSGITAKVPYHTFRTMEQAKEVAGDIKQEFHCKSIEELRRIPADQLVQNSFQNNEMTVDGYAITEQPYLTYLAGNNNEEAILGGYNGNEAYVFMMFDKTPDVDSYAQYLSKVAGEYATELAGLRPVTTEKEAKTNYFDLVGMAWFGYSHYRWSEYMRAEGRPAYLYYFTKKNKSLGDWHAGEMPYFYGNLPRNGNYNESDDALSETIQKYILNYVKTGDPNGEGLPLWERYNEHPNQVLHLDDRVEMIDNTYLDVFQLYDKYMDSKSAP